MKFERIFCFGDSITLGCNDSQGLGWPGRLALNLKHTDGPLATYNLGINGDTSLDIAVRWRKEAEARSRNSPGLILFAFGFNDAAKADGKNCQVDLETSIATARGIVAEAKSVSQVLWIGPTPLDESINPIQTNEACWDMRNADIERYDSAYATIAEELSIDYLPLFPEFVDSSRYQAALLTSDGVHPADDGYDLIAEKISAWGSWQDCL